MRLRVVYICMYVKYAVITRNWNGESAHRYRYTFRTVADTPDGSGIRYAGLDVSYCNGLRCATVEKTFHDHYTGVRVRETDRSENEL